MADAPSIATVSDQLTVLISKIDALAAVIATFAPILVPTSTSGPKLPTAKFNAASNTQLLGAL